MRDLLLLFQGKKISLWLIAALLFPISASANKCFYLASYHQGYEWSDRVEQGLRKQLEGKCELMQFNMDTKRNKDEAFKVAAGLKARELILLYKPDVIIASDDNASKYVIKPFFKDHSIPVVFCGVNWTVDNYGYPYKNATGMVEIAPVNALIQKVTEIQGSSKKAFFLAVDVISEQKNLKHFQQEAKKFNLGVDYKLVKTMPEWLEAYKTAQESDFLLLGSNSGIVGWDKAYVISEILKMTRKLSVTTRDWMMDYAIFGMTKIAEEQGDWAGQVTLALLNGSLASDIPVVSNRKWDIWLNDALQKKSGIKIPNSVVSKAHKAYPRIYDDRRL